jgi:hypothetical protein
MDTRALAALGLVAATMACSPDSERAATTSPMALHSAVPAAWHPIPAARASTFMLWVFRTEDCLSCQALDYELRRVQRRYGHRIPLVAVHIGGAKHESVARAFLTTRRVQASLVTVPPSEYRRLFGESVLPSVHVVQEGRIAWSAEIFNDTTPLAPRLDRALHSLGQRPSGVR